MSVRIANVCPIAGGGGITEAFFNGLEMLKQQGMTPIAIVPANFAYKQRIHELDIETHFIANLEGGGALNLIKQAIRLRQTISQVKPDLLILNNGRHVTVAKMIMPDLPTVAIFHGGKPQRFRRADKVIAINDDQVSSLIDLGFPSDRAAIVDNALPVDHIAPYKPHSSLSSRPIIGTMMLLEPAKGVDVLIDAMAQLKQQGITAELRIAGTGPAKQHLEEHVQALDIKEQVHFLGWVEDQLSFYQQLDLFVLPSHSEEWGLVIVEAQAASLPVIATRTRGPKRIIEHGVTGLLVPIADPTAMADAIENLVTDHELSERLARAGHAKCKEAYMLPKIAPQFTNQILQVL
jgi:glycosyltransferase involved in cell wall biosynthesis